MTVLDWRPFDYFTVGSAAPGSPDGDVTTYRLAPTANGTEPLVTTGSRPDASGVGWPDRPSDDGSIVRSINSPSGSHGKRCPLLMEEPDS
jgi:hypothetical protein